jgi:hypothetical protein
MVSSTDAGVDRFGGTAGRVGGDIVDRLYGVACYYRVIVDCRLRCKIDLGGGKD